MLQDHHHRGTMKLRLALFCAALSLHAVPAVAAPAPSSVEARIARVEHGLSTPVVLKGVPGQKMDLRARMAHHHVPAVSIALIDGGKVQWARAYGVVEAGQSPVVAATPQTPFQAASVSKPVAALGALRLVQQGKLSLDQPVNDQLKSWKLPDNDLTRAKPVTLRMLLNHSAGTTVHGYDGYAQHQALPTLLQVLDALPPAQSPPVRVDTTPGSVWRYSGGGFSVVQQLMADATGESFEPYMQREILKPLHMTHSTFAAPLPQHQRAATAAGHLNDGTVLPGRWNTYPESAAAGLWTTPTDLAQVVLEMQRATAGASGTVLSQDSATAMLTRGRGEYGLGFYVEDLGPVTSFSHTGGTAGFRAQLYGYTGSGKGVVILTNSDNGAALIEEILASISEEYDWPEFKVVEKAALPGNAEVNQQLAGRYSLLDAPAELVADGDRLFLQSALLGAHRLELFALSPDRFFMTDQDRELQVQRDGDGNATGFSLERGASAYQATRTH